MDYTAIFEAVITLIGAIITCVIIPWIKSKTTAEQQEKINMWVKIAVNAAEQIYVGSGRGEEKKKYVIEFLNNIGVKVSEDRIDALIESAVYALNSGIVSK